MPRRVLVPATIAGPVPDPKYGPEYNSALFLRDPIAYMTTLYRDYGPLAALVRGGQSMVFAFEPQGNRAILTQPDVLYSIGLTLHGPFDSAQRRVGYGLFSLNMQENRDRRKMLMPSVRREAVTGHHDQIAQIVQREIADWRPGEQRDILWDMSKLTLAIAGEVLFGIEGGFDKENGKQRIGTLIAEWSRMNCIPSMRLSTPENPSAAYRRMLSTAEKIEAEIKSIIARKRSQGSTGDDALGLLLRAHEDSNQAMTEAELVGQANILIAAAYETTAHTLTWTLFLLSQHPEVAARLVEELAAELWGNPPRSDQLERLPLLHNVLNESLRLIGPVVYNTRVNIRKVELAGHELPKGSLAVYSPYITHHMAELYPEPNRFFPARWDTFQPTPYEFLPFGAGTRMCIGKGFAETSAKIALATILQHYRLEMVPQTRVDRRVYVTLFPRRGMPMVVHKQDGAYRAVPVSGNIHEMVDLPK